MIKTNLIVSIAEDAVGGDTEAVTLKTTSLGNVIVEMHCPKIAIKLGDLNDAIKAIEDFISSRPVVITTTANDDTQPTFEFQYNTGIEEQQAI